MSSVYSQSWTSLGLGLNDKCRVLLNDTANNKLIAGGDFTYAGGQSANFIAAWDCTTWSTIGQGFNAPVYALAIYNNELYAGGNFTMSGTDTVKYLAKWNGATWVSVGSGIANNKVKFLKTYNGKLYISGDFTSYGNIAKRNITWNGTAFDSIAGFTYPGAITDIAFYKFKTYFACNGILISSNGFTFQGIGGSGSSTGAIYIKSLEVDTNQDLLYVAGYNTNTNSQYCADVYDGANFQGYTMFNAVYPTDGPVNVIKSVGNDLYMGGDFLHAAYGVNVNFTVNNITRFNPNTQTFYAINSGTNGEVLDIELFNNSLYIAGDFIYAGTSTSNFISRLSSPSTAVTEVFNNNEISIYPNPSTGLFTITMQNNSIKSKLEIYNMLGEKVLEQLNVKPQPSMEIDLSAYPKGVYFVKINDETKIVSSKIVVE